MEYTKIIKDSVNTVTNNIFMYGLSALIVVFGSSLIITGPPLSYGYVYMLMKGQKNEILKLSDVFEGFQPGNFSRSWICMLLIIAISFVILLIGVFFAAFIGLALFSFLKSLSYLPDSVMYAVTIALLVIFGSIITLPAVFIMYTFTLLVIREYTAMDALKESIQLVKTNFVPSIIFTVVIGIIMLLGVLPYYVGFFLGLPGLINLLIYITGILLSFPFSQQLLVNITMELIDE